MALTGCSSTRPPKPIAQLTPTEADGYRLFQSQCAPCHHDREPGPLHGPSLMDLYQKPNLPSGAPANDDRVAATIHHGRNLMPAQTQLDDTQVTALIAYLHTL